MPVNYPRLSFKKRMEIYYLSKEGHSQREINRSKGSVTTANQEVDPKRNSGTPTHRRHSKEVN